MEDGVVCPAGATAREMGEHKWGLGNLLQACARAAEDEWTGLVNRHFEMVLSAQRATMNIDLDSFDYGVVASQLVVRLWDQDAFADKAVKDTLIFRRDIPGLMTVLSMDMPEAVRTVPTTEAEMWGRGRDELFAAAIENVKRLAEAKTDAHELGDGGVVVSVLGDSHFVASLALSIDSRPELISKHGAFVGLPTRHVMLAAPFGGLDAFKSLQHLIMITRKWCEDGPGSLSPRVWWYREGVWHEIACEVDGDRLNVTPPPELVELMNELGGGRGLQGDDDHDDDEESR